MGEGAAVLHRLDPLRRERLAVLGYELFALRQAGAVASPAAEGPDATPGEALRPRLTILGIEADERDAPLLRGLMAGLGLRAGEVRFETAVDVPTLVLGSSHADATFRGPTLAELRTPSAKRAAWPILRRLRRQLQQDWSD